MYTLLSTIVLAYSAVAILFVLFSTYFEIKTGFRHAPQAKFQMFQIMNKLHGKKTILIPFQIFSVVALISWVALALPWIGVFTGFHLYSSFENGILITPFGEFVGESGNYYFVLVLFTIVGTKGYFVCKKMADILRYDHLAVNQMGQWAGKSDFN